MRVAALSQFISRSAEKYLLFFKAVMQAKDFVWLEECQFAFEELKKYLGLAPLLSKPIKGEPIFEEGRTDTILNPCIIFEVFSKSSSSRDRGDKFTYYRSIPHFQEYILINQYQAHLEQFSKTPENNWLFSESDTEDGVLTLTSANCQISHRQIYERVNFNIND